MLRTNAFKGTNRWQLTQQPMAANAFGCALSTPPMLAPPQRLKERA